MKKLDKIRQLTPEQLALSQARKQQKLRKQQEALPSILNSRSWLAFPEIHTVGITHRVKVLTWNLLAQCLISMTSGHIVLSLAERWHIGRELFPTSDCLKANKREPMLHEDIMRQDAHILCLQEVDRLETLLPLLDNAGYLHTYASGPGKMHGCLIAFKDSLYTLVSHKVIHYDDQELKIPNEFDKESRRGISFRTRNIALLVALRRKADVHQGVIVATTHLFWHPRYTYERIRQCGILIRETVAFRKEENVGHWPCVIAGDFNFTPNDAAYSLVFGDPLLPEQGDSVVESRVVHATIDQSARIPTDLPNFKASEDDEESDLRLITNARPAIPDDGLLTLPEIVTWFHGLPRLRSAYCEGLRRAKEIGMDVKGERTLVSAGRRGFNEPQYTSYTTYWKSALDYIFFLDAEQPGIVTGLAKPLSAKELDPGIPKARVSGSDHTSLVAELIWQ